MLTNISHDQKVVPSLSPYTRLLGQSNNRVRRSIRIEFEACNKVLTQHRLHISSVDTAKAASEVIVEPSSSAELLEWIVAVKSVVPLHWKAIERAEIVILKPLC